MQFSYGITEADYVKAWKLRVRAGFLPKTSKSILFWVFIMICLIVLWAVVQQDREHSATTTNTATDVASVDDSPQPAPAQPSDLTKSLIVNVGPFVLIAAIWLSMLFSRSSLNIRMLYRNDPGVQGRYTIEITPDFIAIQNTAGFSSRSGWNIYEYWKEGKDLAILGLRSKAYFPISLSELSSGERDELRAVLSAVLPKK